MRRNHIIPIALAAMAAGGGGAVGGSPITIEAAEKQAADMMRVPRGARSWRKSPGTIASKRRRNRRRGG